MAKAKGAPKSGGRVAGTPNRTTKEARDMLEQILFGQIENIAESLERLRDKSDGYYLDTCSKFFAYVLPKKTDITSGDEPIKQTLNITIDKSETAETLKKLRDGDKIN